MMGEDPETFTQEDVDVSIVHTGREVVAGELWLLDTLFFSINPYEFNQASE